MSPLHYEQTYMNTTTKEVESGGIKCILAGEKSRGNFFSVWMARLRPERITRGAHDRNQQEGPIEAE